MPKANPLPLTHDGEQKTSTARNTAEFLSGHMHQSATALHCTQSIPSPNRSAADDAFGYVSETPDDSTKVWILMPTGLGKP